MSEIKLSGLLLCKTLSEALIVERHLPLHITLTNAELGCLSFEVVVTQNPLVWQVDELFSNEVTFAAHQKRVAASEWGRVTAHIERRYEIGGLTPRRPASPSGPQL